MAGRRALVFALFQKSARLPPVPDESGQDASFARFRRELLAGLARQDVRYLLPVVADDVKVSFGDPDGRASFGECWGLDRPAQSKVYCGWVWGGVCAGAKTGRAGGMGGGGGRAESFGVPGRVRQSERAVADGVSGAGGSGQRHGGDLGLVEAAVAEGDAVEGLVRFFGAGGGGEIAEGLAVG